MSRGRAVLLILLVILVFGAVIVGLRFDAARTDRGLSDTSTTAFVPPVNGGPRAVFIGDSYVSGAGASDLAAGGHRSSRRTSCGPRRTSESVPLAMHSRRRGVEPNDAAVFRRWQATPSP